MIIDATFWVAISFVIFLLLLVYFRIPLKVKKILVKPVLLDANLHKQFKNHHFSKIDLHGLTVDQAHQKLIEYFLQK